MEVHGDKIPVGTYKVGFSDLSGFFLEKVAPLDLNTEKVYGEYPEKVAKISRAYEKFNRSLGLILSGKKGIGKTMSLVLLSRELAKKSVPTILVQDNFEGLPAFLSSIQQDVLIIFDEFEKKFPSSRVSDSRNEVSTSSFPVTQEDFLSLFDGLSTNLPNRHIYAVTVNDLYKLSDFFLARPGRFHYHIRYNDLSIETIRQYLEDKVEEGQPARKELDLISGFCYRKNFNFDMLRSLVEELNFGEPFESAVQDLNIVDNEEEEISASVSFMIPEGFGRGVRYTSKCLDLIAGGKALKVSSIPSEVDFAKGCLTVEKVNLDEDWSWYLEGNVYFDTARVEYSKEGILIPVTSMKPETDLYIFKQGNREEERFPIPMRSILDVSFESASRFMRENLAV